MMVVGIWRQRALNVTILVDLLPGELNHLSPLSYGCPPGDYRAYTGLVLYGILMRINYA